MKILSAIIVIFLSFPVYAQTKNETHIDTAGTVNIYSGNTYIAKATIIEAPGSKVFLSKDNQSIDTAKIHNGEYKTVFTFVGENGVVMNKVIDLHFDKPVISCDLKMPHGGSVIRTGASNKEKTFFRFVIGQLSASDFQFIIYSKEKVFTIINGISGRLSQ